MDRPRRNQPVLPPLPTPPPRSRLSLLEATAPSLRILAAIRDEGLTVNQFGRELFDPKQQDSELKSAGQSFLSSPASIHWLNLFLANSHLRPKLLTWAQTSITDLIPQVTRERTHDGATFKSNLSHSSNLICAIRHSDILL